MTAGETELAAYATATPAIGVPILLHGKQSSASAKAKQTLYKQSQA
jgi:hypothetical protein